MRFVRRLAIAAVVLLAVGVVGTAALFLHRGYRVYVVHTGSMTPTYRPGDLIIDRPPASGYRAGDVITFRHSSTTDDVVTHRVTDVTAAGLVHTKGDANRSADVWDIRPGQVQGVTSLGVRGAGYLLVYLQQGTGIASLASAVVAVCLLWSMFFGQPTAVHRGTHRRVATRGAARRKRSRRPAECAIVPTSARPAS